MAHIIAESTRGRRARGRWLLTVGALVTVLLAGLGITRMISATSVVPADDARAFAAALQEDVLAGDLEAPCAVALSERLCRESLKEYRERAPEELAAIVCTWRLEGSEAQVVVLSGVDGSGDPYVNHMPVLRDNGRLVSSSSVYWRNYGVPNDNSVTADSGGGSPQPVCN